MIDSAARVAVGWREWLALPELGIDAIKAKIDTGARSSCLHVDALEAFSRSGREFVRFSLAPGPRRTNGLVTCEAEVIDVRAVTDSGGHTTDRYFIRSQCRLGGLEWPIEINLTRRMRMLFPMLLGRTALAGHFLVDPELSFHFGHPGELP